MNSRIHVRVFLPQSFAVYPIINNKKVPNRKVLLSYPMFTKKNLYNFSACTKRNYEIYKKMEK